MKLTFGVTSLLTASAAASPSPRGILKIQEMSNISRNSVAKQNKWRKKRATMNQHFVSVADGRLPIPQIIKDFQILSVTTQYLRDLERPLNSRKIGLCIQDFGILCVLYVCCWLDFVFFVGLWQVGLTLASPHGKAEGAQMVCEETQFAENQDVPDESNMHRNSLTELFSWYYLKIILDNSFQIF